MKPNACFRNIDGSDTYPLDQVVYRSEVDGNLLEVVHDYDALRALHSPDEWKKLFAERKGSVHSPWDSGIWGKKELVLPEIDEKNIVSLGEGWTQLFDAAPLAKKLRLKELRVKLCGNSHSGSFKDLGMTVLVSQVNQMIADGKHLPKEILRMVWKFKGADRTALCTDALAPAGQPEGTVFYNGRPPHGAKSVIHDGVGKLIDHSALAGSIATADRLVRVMYKEALVPLPDAVEMMTLSPAKMVRAHRKGSIRLCKDADFVLFDDDINVKAVYSRGKKVEL